MNQIENSTPSLVSKDIFEDLGFSKEEASILRLKTKLHIDLIKEIEEQGLSPKSLSQLFSMEKESVTNLLAGKLSTISVDTLVGCLALVGREVLIDFSPVDEQGK